MQVAVRRFPEKHASQLHRKDVPIVTPLTAVVTTFNNADTLRSCLESVKWANEIVVLDSFSTDETCQIAAEFSCVIKQHSCRSLRRKYSSC